MSPERIVRIRQKLATARAKGANGSTTVDLMVLTIEELETLLDANERYDFRTSELLEDCNKWVQAYRDTKDALHAAVIFAKHAAQALGQDYHP